MELMSAKKTEIAGQVIQPLSGQYYKLIIIYSTVQNFGVGKIFLVVERN